PGSCPLTFLLGQHELHHSIHHLLHQLPVPGLQPGAQPASSVASIYVVLVGSGSMISLSHSTSFWGGPGSGRHPDLGDYLDRVRSLETNNQRLIWGLLEKKGPHIDWVHYFKTMEDLKAHIFANSADNARIVLQIDSAHLATKDFRVKSETKLAMYQSVESDIHGLHKVTDDTSITQLQLQ
uniref:IF rod domain-containing protein n=1 Tax=Otolemur garnettii TaxID=30611 RepID=H0XZD6_OTOGA